MNKITQEEEFLDAEINFKILTSELRKKIIDLQQDLAVILDAEVKGFAEKRYLELKKVYFALLKDDMDLQNKFAVQGILQDGLISRQEVE